MLFFPLHWVVVHPIDEQSPLRGVTQEEFAASDAEILILLSAMAVSFWTVALLNPIWPAILRMLIPSPRSLATSCLISRVTKAGSGVKKRSANPASALTNSSTPAAVWLESK